MEILEELSVMSLRSKLVAALAGLPLLVLLAPSATAAPLTAHVQVYGRIACGTGYAPPLPGPSYFAVRARFQAANGEARDARISQLVNYTVDFYNVPAGGETVNVYVTCGGNGRQYGKSFRLVRQSSQRQEFNILG